MKKVYIICVNEQPTYVFSTREKAQEGIKLLQGRENELHALGEYLYIDTSSIVSSYTIEEWLLDSLNV